MIEHKQPSKSKICEYKVNDKNNVMNFNEISLITKILSVKICTYTSM
jgi:hypothetical protein